MNYKYIKKFYYWINKDIDFIKVIEKCLDF